MPMRNLPFVLWMLGFPALQWGVRQKPTFSTDSGEELAYAVIFLLIWFVVGYLVYEKRPEKPESEQSTSS